MTACRYIVSPSQPTISVITRDSQMCLLKV